MLTADDTISPYLQSAIARNWHSLSDLNEYAELVLSGWLLLKTSPMLYLFIENRHWRGNREHQNLLLKLNLFSFLRCLRRSSHVGATKFHEKVSVDPKVAKELLVYTTSLKPLPHLINLSHEHPVKTPDLWRQNARQMVNTNQRPDSSYSSIYPIDYVCSCAISKAVMRSLFRCNWEIGSDVSGRVKDGGWEKRGCRSEHFCKRIIRKLRRTSMAKCSAIEYSAPRLSAW